MQNQLNCSFNNLNYFINTNSSSSNLRQRSTAEEKEHDKEKEKEKVFNYSLPQLNSPRSQRALKTLGFIKNELHYLTFNQYKHNHPSIYQLPPHFQHLRYQFYNTHRIEKIEQVMDTKKRITITPSKQTINQSQLIKGLHRSCSTFIHNKLRQYERLQSKNDLEMMSTILQEIEKEIVNNEIKADDLQRKRNEAIKLETGRIQRQKQIDLSMSNSSILLSPSSSTSFNAKDDYLIQRQRRQRENVNKVNQMQENYMNYLNSKRSEIEEKIALKKAEIEKKRLNKSNETKDLMQYKQNKVDKNRTIIEHKSDYFKQSLIKKDKQSTLRRNQLRKNQILLNDKHKEESMEKELNIKKTISHNQSEFDLKASEFFNRKQLDNDRIQSYFDNKNEENNRLKQQTLNKNNHIYEAHLRHEAMIEEKRHQMMIRNSEREDNMNKNFEMRQINKFLSKEEENKLQFLREDKIQMMQNLVKYQQEDVLNRIKDKQQRAKEFLMQKNKINEEIRRIPKQIEYERNAKEAKLRRAIGSKSFNKKTIETFKELFPNKNVFNDMIDQLRRSNSKLKSMEGNSSHNAKYSIKSNHRNHCLALLSHYSNDLSLNRTIDKDIKLRTLVLENEIISNKTNRSIDVNSKINDTSLSSIKAIDKEKSLQLKLIKHKRELSKELDSLLSDNNSPMENTSEDTLSKSKRIVELNDAIEREMVMYRIKLKNQS